LPSGERLWEESSPIGRRAVSTGTAFLVRDARGDGLHWLFTENGELILARLTRDGYQEIDRAKLLDTTNVAFGREVVWSMPAFANRRVYARNDRELICVDLADTASGG
ncbi:MAG: pyrrolo-quinoline quinone, partial [Planctomycetota bacterium]